MKGQGVKWRLVTRVLGLGHEDVLAAIVYGAEAARERVVSARVGRVA